MFPILSPLCLILESHNALTNGALAYVMLFQLRNA